MRQRNGAEETWEKTTSDRVLCFVATRGGETVPKPKIYRCRIKKFFIVFDKRCDHGLEADVCVRHNILSMRFCECYFEIINLYILSYFFLNALNIGQVKKRKKEEKEGTQAKKIKKTYEKPFWDKKET